MTLAQIIDNLIDDAADADVYGVPDWRALERRAYKEAKRRGLAVTEQDVHMAVQQEIDD